MSFEFVLTEKPLKEAIWPVRFDVARKLPLAYCNIITDTGNKTLVKS